MSRSQLPQAIRRCGTALALATCGAMALPAGTGATGAIETGTFEGTFAGLWSATFPPATKASGDISFRRLTGSADASARRAFDARLRDCVRAEGSVLYRGSYDYGGSGTVQACEDPAQAGRLVGYYVNGGGWRKAGHGTFTLNRADAHGQERFTGFYSRATRSQRTGSQTLAWRGLRRATFSKVSFRFRGYANSVRVVPPLIGEWQLGRVTYEGSGTLDLVTDRATGSLVDRDDGRRGIHRITERMVRVFSVQRRTEYVRMSIRVQVTRSNHLRSCPLRTYGTLTIYDHQGLLPNGQDRDSIAIAHPRSGGPTKAPDGGRACRTHIHGFNNTDGGERTSPSQGGPPNGGQWAIVTIALS